VKPSKAIHAPEEATMISGHNTHRRRRRSEEDGQGKQPAHSRTKELFQNRRSPTHPSFSLCSDKTIMLRRITLSHLFIPRRL
jgi:hypothetical protein